MKKQSLVVRTVHKLSVEAVVMEKNDEMPHIMAFEMPTSFAKLNPGKQLAKLRMSHETDTLKIINIITIKENQKKYVIPVETFMEYAMEVE